MHEQRLYANTIPSICFQKDSELQTRHLIWILILVFIVMKFTIMAHLELGVDEAHYALYGRHLAWSYYDHPPLLGWLIFISQKIFGDHNWSIRLPALLCHLVTIAVGLHILKPKQTSDLSTDQKNWLYLLLFSPLMWILSIMPLPDSVLIALGLWLVLIVKTTLETTSVPWVQLGFCLGLAGLTKFTAALWIPGLLWICRKHFLQHKLKILGAVLISAFIVSPVFIWNAQNNWMSFRYQSGHLVGGSHFDFQSLILSWIAQYAIAFLFIWPWSFIKSRPITSMSLVGRIVFALSLPSFLFFLYSSTKTFLLPHWLAPIWILVFLALAEKSSALKCRAISVQIAVIILLMAEMIFHFIPFQIESTPYRDVGGWSVVRQAIEDLIKEKKVLPNAGIAVSNWSLGSRARYYFEDRFPVQVMDDRFDQFDLWEKEETRVADQWVSISPKDYDVVPADRLKCKPGSDIQEIKVQTRLGASVNNEFRVQWCN